MLLPPAHLPIRPSSMSMSRVPILRRHHIILAPVHMARPPRREKHLDPHHDQTR